MKKTGYLVWVNDDQFWHSTLGSAQKRSRLAKMRGNDSLIVGFQIQPFLVEKGTAKRAS
jgi:hypothetical protein